MRIGVIGAGHVGLVIAAGFADFGNEVWCMDQNRILIGRLRTGTVHFHEPGLKTLVEQNLAAGRMHFCDTLAPVLEAAEVIFIAVGTDPNPDGSPNLDHVMAVANGLAREMRTYKVIVLKSTVPVGTAARVRAAIKTAQAEPVPFDVVSNPEFLREGSALETFFRPDRVVLGTSSEQAEQIMRNLYRPLYLIETPLLVTSNETAELIKYASNAFLAMKISFINEVANLSDALGCDVHVVAKAVGLDRRIGPKFLHPGPGYGGSCLPKDTRALLQMGEEQGISMHLLKANIETNEEQPRRILSRVERRVGGLPGRLFAVLGLSYKPNTDDVRQSPAVQVCQLLIERGAILRLHDPVANPRAIAALAGSQVECCSNPYEAAAGADGIIVLTEWNEFRSLDLRRIHDALQVKLLFDMRNIFDPVEAGRIGFTYESMGRNVVALHAPGPLAMTERNSSPVLAGSPGAC